MKPYYLSIFTNNALLTTVDNGETLTTKIDGTEYQFDYNPQYKDYEIKEFPGVQFE